jgi:predicted Zn finger-like uncharacterized protein
MANYNFICPHCGKTYEIQNYSLGFLDAFELRCNRCSNTLWVGFYDKDTAQFIKIYKDKNGDVRQENDQAGLEAALNPCECGGSFHESSPYRCKICNNEVDLKEIIKQIGWRGASNGKPGIAMGKVIDGDKSRGAIWKKNKK